MYVIASKHCWLLCRNGKRYAYEKSLPLTLRCNTDLSPAPSLFHLPGELLSVWCFPGEGGVPYLLEPGRGTLHTWPWGGGGLLAAWPGEGEGMDPYCSSATSLAKDPPPQLGQINLTENITAKGYYCANSFQCVRELQAVLLHNNPYCFTFSKKNLMYWLQVLFYWNTNDLLANTDVDLF